MNIRENISLKTYHTFRMDVYARYFSGFSNEEELFELLEFSSTSGGLMQMVLGGGSNVLFTRDFNGIVLKNEIRGIELVSEDNEFYYVKAGAGENWHLFVLHCLDHDRFGVENLALIPGSVGASPMQNIGAYGVELKDVFHSLEAIHLKDLSKVTLTADDCAFGYRESIFKNVCKDIFIITAVTFRLRKKPALNISYGSIAQELEKKKISEMTARDVAEAVISIRRSKLPDPEVAGNAGSFFKNPEVAQEKFKELQQEHPAIVAYPSGKGKMKLAAGWLIEQCGWKGYRNGDAGCHPAQALVLVNYGNAKGLEIADLAEKIKKDVLSRFSVMLETEVNII